MMRTNRSTPSLLRAAIAACAMLLVGGWATAQSSVTLTAAPTSTTLPDGQVVPMWGYTCGATSDGSHVPSRVACTAANGTPQGGGWQPPLIRVPAGQPLTITLVNSLSFGTNTVPTSLVIVGQLGGGLGTDRATMPSPVHAPQGTTWPGTLGGVDTSVTAIVVTAPGTGYTTATPVSISGGGGSGATAAVSSVDVSGRITGVTVLSPGSGYTSRPAITFGGSGTGAAATATLTGLSADTPTFVPPAQADRVRSFGTEVKVSDSGGKTLTWNNLRPGTYLIESGTQPSIQGPMGLYGMLVVTEPDSGEVHQAYGDTYDFDVPLLLSEIDPVQNAEVAQVVANASFSDTLVWSGATDACGDVAKPASAHFCYPPAVNYSPLYYLVNGVSFDRTNPGASTLSVPAAGAQKNVLLRFVNAGLRMHVPSVVGTRLTLLAEDGNKLPGGPRVQAEVLLTAGKTYDVAIQPPQTASAGSYDPATLAVFDRALSLSTANQRDGGMQAYVALAGGALSGAGSPGSTSSLAGDGDRTFYCISGVSLTVSDPSKGLLSGVSGANGVALGGAFTGVANAASISLQSNGTFTYVPPATGTCAGSFTFNINSTKLHTATIADCETSTACKGAAPTAGNGSFTSNVASRLQIAPPGVLAFVTNPSGHALTAIGGTTPTTCASVTLNPDGSFLAQPATPGTTCTFSYKVSTSTKMTSTEGTVTVNFLSGSGLAVNVFDAPSAQPGSTKVAINDYRWIIEEDRTFWIDPKCQVNSPGASRIDSQGNACPDLPVESLGYNFHTANMPVVASGCVGVISCEAGQARQGLPVACELGNGDCRAAAQKAELSPADVHLDPTKRYFISVLPGDGVNPTIAGAGGPNPDGSAFSIAKNCGIYDPAAAAWAPGASTGICGHEMGGAQIAKGQTAVNIALQETPLPTAKLSVFVFQDDNPLNGENDAGGGVDVVAPNEAGLGGFEIKLFDQAGGLGDNTGQPTYDEFNQPLTNALAGHIDPITHLDACPITRRNDGTGKNFVGMIPTCPKYESDGVTISPLAGQVVIENLYPGLYEVQAYPAADRIGRGEEWLQTNTLDGGKPHEAFIKPNEPGYFQEFGPGGFHVAIGFANPKIINDRKGATGDGKGLVCSGQACTSSLTVKVSNNHMSRTPDQRTYGSGNYDHYAFTQCYVSVGLPDGIDFAFEKCDDGVATFKNMPGGTYKIAVFDQWNDIMLDGLVSSVTINGDVTKELPVTQWRTNLSTRTYIDANGNGIPDRDASGNDLEAGLSLVNTNIRYRDGSFGFFNNTDLNGYAGFNEVFPFMNWLVVETSSTRFKPTGIHTVYDAGGPPDGTGIAGAGDSIIASHLANTMEKVPLPAAQRVPGARYCGTADCLAGDATGGSSGTVMPPQAWGVSQGWQGLLGQDSFIEFGMKPFRENENGGINGHVIYASTRPFDDPSLSLQLSWEPGVPRVRINLYRKGTDEFGNDSLTLVDTTTTTSWDDWAQGFRKDADGNLVKDASGKYVPNMNCPGQSNTSPFFATLANSKEWLDPGNLDPAHPGKLPLASNAQFKCYDGWSQLNQIQPAPYDGMYAFPSVTAIDTLTGRPAKSNCTGCIPNPDSSDPIRAGTPMLPAGKYVVEVIVPPGFELVKEEDKNILLGDVFIAPVTQQFAGFGNIFIMPDQASVNAHYNAANPGALNLTDNLGSVTFPRHEGDTGSIESYWPCVGARRIVPDFNSLFPGAGQAAPFAGASRNLCDRKEVTLQAQASVLAKFFIFSSTHIAGHFAGTITNDFASEFDPFSPQFGEKFGPPNLPVGLRDFNGNEVARVYSDQWGIYNGLYFSSWSVNPPNPTGYAPQMSIACMNDPGPIPDPAHPGQMITDPAYSPAYSNFCYETPFMPGFTAYMDTPVIPTMAFADGYNLPDAEYPNNTPAILSVTGDSGIGPWVASASGSVLKSVSVTAPGGGYTVPPTVTFTGGLAAGGTAATGTAMLAPASVGALTLGSSGSGYSSVPAVAFIGTGSGAVATAAMKVSDVGVTASGQGSYLAASPVVTVTFSAPPCTLNGTTCVRATGTVVVSTTGTVGTTDSRRRVTGVTIVNPGAGYTAAPTLTFSRGSATAAASLGVASLALTNGGAGYTVPPLVAFLGDGTGTAATTTLAPTSVASIAISSFGSGYTAAPAITFAGGNGTGAAAAATLGATGTLTITALGDKTVINPNFSGPNSTAAPYNQKTITRHYGFGATAGTVALVDAKGVSHPLLAPTWSDTTITGTVPSDLPNCSVSNASYTGANANAKCGQLVITAADGKRSIDAVTVTIGGTPPWVVTPAGVSAPGGRAVTDYGTSFGRMGASPIQTAIDSAAPGDLIIVAPGTYRENLIMWKPVRLQGVGAPAVTINADAHPAGKMDQWRRQVDCVFGLDLEGIPNLDDVSFDSGGGYSCPAGMHQRVDRIQFEAITGWDASGNGNLAQVLQEPTLMGAYEGAGITVLGRGIRIPANSFDFWGADPTAAGAFPIGAVYIGNADCSTASATRVDGRDYGTGNFYCNPSRIDGLSIINSSQGGGGLFIHGWAQNLEVANNRISGNHGTLAGGINLGNGETPSVYLNDGVICGVGVATAAACPPFVPFIPLLAPNGVRTNGAIPFQWNTNVRIHHNMIYNNASIGDALFTGTPAGAGGITVSAGADGYSIDHNWIAGNLSTGDGGGVQQLGVSFNARIANNYVLFNQSTNPTLPTNGGGIVVEGANEPRTLNGTECGGATDGDCPPGLGEGTGQGLVIDANLIIGNSAESGSGGGLRLSQVNGTEVGLFPNLDSQWYAVSVTNNIIANNVAGWDGGGVSLQDALKVSFVNNTVASNDTTASAGSLFKTLGAVSSTAPGSGCSPPSDPSAPLPPGCDGSIAPHGPQPAGLVTMAHTPNLLDALATVGVTCPANFGYSGTTTDSCKSLSKPLMVNNLFWQNRSFSVDIVSTKGAGLQDQQAIVGLTPQLNQATTGDCASGTANPATFYWDIGLRTDDLAAHLLSTSNKLTLLNSILTNDQQGVIVASATNKVGTSPAFVAPFCNGARIPPENCASQAGQTTQASCKGYNTPVGASETTSTSELFVFNGIQPTATVDEGHNWLNLSYGPLTLSRPTASTATAAEKLVGDVSAGLAGAAYSPASGSPAASGGAAAVAGVIAPTQDFFGSTRGASVGIGAVQIAAPPPPPPPLPTLTLLDNFNRAAANTLGANWSQATLAGLAAVRVVDATTGNTATGLANATTAGNAYWNVPAAGFGAKQGAAFTIANGTLNGDSLILKANGTVVLGVTQNFIRVRVTGTQVVIETTSNFGTATTPAATLAATFASGDTLSAVADGAGMVYVWKTSGGGTPVTTYVGLATTTFTGTGRIGIQLPVNARVDNLAGGNVP